MGCNVFSRDYAPPPPFDRKMFSGSVDACFILALPFHHGDLEPYCVGVLTRAGGLMHGMKIPLQDFALKMQGELMREGGCICRTLRYM